MKILHTSKQIQHRVAEIATVLDSKYPEGFTAVCVLKGSFIFTADLVRCLKVPVQVEFTQAISYRGTESTGEVRFFGTPNVFSKHVVVVEDIVDTGLTISKLLDELKKQHPLSIEVCTLLDKPSRRKFPVRLDYIGFEVPDEFVVGYGLDCDEEMRNLPHIAVMKDQTK